MRCPDTIEDVGLNCNRLDTQVSTLATEHSVHVYHNFILKTVRGQDWLKKAERIRCPAPLTEGLPNLVLTQMLKHAPNKVPSGKDEGRSKEAEGRFHTLYIQTGGINASMEGDDRGGESQVPSPRGTKRAASEDMEAEASKLGKKPSPGSPAPEGVLSAQHPQTGQPSTKL